MPLTSITCHASAVIFGLSILFSALSAPAAAAEAATMAGLQGDGWRVMEKHEHQEKRPGLPPYENLTRVVQITTLVLTKEGQHMTCRMAYDSQRDKITEACRPGSDAK